MKYYILITDSKHGSKGILSYHQDYFYELNLKNYNPCYSSTKDIVTFDQYDKAIDMINDIIAKKALHDNNKYPIMLMNKNWINASVIDAIELGSYVYG